MQKLHVVPYRIFKTLKWCSGTIGSMNFFIRKIPGIMNNIELQPGELSSKYPGWKGTLGQ